MCVYMCQLISCNSISNLWNTAMQQWVPYYKGGKHDIVWTDTIIKAWIHTQLINTFNNCPALLTQYQLDSCERVCGSTNTTGQPCDCHLATCWPFYTTTPKIPKTPSVGPPRVLVHEDWQVWQENYWPTTLTYCQVDSGESVWVQLTTTYNFEMFPSYPPLQLLTCVFEGCWVFLL